MSVHPAKRSSHTAVASTGSWSILPECPTSEFAMVDIDGNLTIIGGYLKETSGYSNCLYMYNEYSSDKQHYWNDDYPRMPTKRKAAAAICTQSVVIVAGGEGEGGNVVAKVEVMDISAKVWCSAVSLPSGRKNASIAACGHCLYLVGGDINGDEKTTTYVCSLSVLLKTRQPETIIKKLEKLDRLRYWVRITSISFGGQLYTIGGNDSDGRTVRGVYIYDPSVDNWQLTSRMVKDRNSCVAAALQNNRMIIFGGLTDKNLYLNTIETGHLSSIEGN